MGQVRVNSGAVAIARVYETTLGGGSTLSHLMHAVAPVSSRNFRFKNVEDEARGLEEMSDQVDIRDETSLAFPSMPLNDVSFGAHMAYGVGSKSKTTPSGATNARQHGNSSLDITTELSSTVLQVNMKDRTTTGSAYMNSKYLGCVLNNFTVNGGVSSGEWQISPTWQTAGFDPQNADAVAGLISPVYSPYKFKNTFCFVGPSFTPGSLLLPSSGVAPTGVELGAGASAQVNLSTRLLGVNWTLNNNLDLEGGHAGTLYGATELIRGQRQQTISLDFKWDPTINFLKALKHGEIHSAVATSGNSRAFSLGIMCFSGAVLDVSGTVYCHGFSLFWPSVYLDGDVKFNNRAGKYAMQVPLRVGQNTTQDSVYTYQWSLENGKWAFNV